MLKLLLADFMGKLKLKWGVLLPGAPDRAYLINKLIRQREQIYHLRLYFSPLRWYYTGRKKSL